MARERTIQQIQKSFRMMAGLAVALLLPLALIGSAQAQSDEAVLLLSITGTPNPAAGGGQVQYAVLVKNESSFKARAVVITIPIPANTSFVSCTTSNATLCTVAGGVATAAVGNIKAHLEVRVTLRLTMPVVTAATAIVVEGSVDSADARDDRNHFTTTVLPPPTSVKFLPSGRDGQVNCGTTLTPVMFGTDRTVQMQGDLGCTSEPFGLKIAAPGVTLDMNLFKIFANQPQTLGNVGIVVAAKKVKILGRGTGNLNGIEFFDWCVKNEGNAAKLTIEQLRCFRARTAGIQIASKTAKLMNLKIDRVEASPLSATADPANSGVGIRLGGDNVHINQTLVIRAKRIGIWMHGTDADGSGRVGLIDGGDRTMRIEKSAEIGVLLENGPHDVTEMYVEGDFDQQVPTSTDGVVVAPTAINSLIDSVVVKKFGGNGFVIQGDGTVVDSCEIEEDGLDGFVAAGVGVTIQNSKAQKAARGFVVTGADAIIDGNEAEELLEDGYVIEGPNATLSANSSKGNGEDTGGSGFIIAGTGGLIELNEAENNGGNGFKITGTGYTIKGNESQKSDLIEWVIAAGNTDGGTNKKDRGTVFNFTLAGGNFE